ncbi:MAG: hypothetical protein VYE31_03380 [Pseudomonadota bacterium]|nr:hypothetical protein [Pseudomonadota bacterium]
MGDPWKSINQEGVRAFTYGVGATILIWLSGEGYLEPVVSFLTIIGFSKIFSEALFFSTILFLLVIMVFYGLHGKLFTTLILEHMPWVKNPDRYLLFFWLWAVAIASGIMNVFEVNVFYQFVSLFFIFLLPSLFLGTRIQKKGGND